VLLSSDDDKLESPSVQEELNDKAEPVKTESNEVMVGFSPSKRSRLSLTQSPPKSPKERRELRRSRRSFREQYKGADRFQMEAKIIKTLYFQEWQ
jgi:hypothetical protein